MLNLHQFSCNISSVRDACRNIIHEMANGATPAVIADEAARVSDNASQLELLAMNATAYAMKHSLPALPEMDALAMACAGLAVEARDLIVGKATPTDPNGYQKLLEAIEGKNGVAALWTAARMKLEG